MNKRITRNRRVERHSTQLHTFPRVPPSTWNKEGAVRSRNNDNFHIQTKKRKKRIEKIENKREGE